MSRFLQWVVVVSDGQTAGVLSVDAEAGAVWLQTRHGWFQGE